jgi:hypothetical protein
MIVSRERNTSMTLKRVSQMMAVLLLLGLVALAEIPAGTRIPVRLSTALSSGTAQSGQHWDGVVARDVTVNGNTIKAGTPVKGVVSSAKSSGRLHAPGIIRIRATSVGGESVRTASVGRQGKSHTKSNALKIGGGAAAGALIGGLAGGGKGAAIGTLAGGGAGTGVAAATGKQEAVYPAESVVTFTVAGATAGTARRR